MNVHPQIDLHVVTGPPAAGKTTYVEQHAQPGDLRVDFDLLAQALGSPHSHNHPDPIRNVLREVFDLLHNAALATPGPVWIVRTVIPDRLMALYQSRGEVVVLHPPLDTVRERLEAQGRDLEPLEWPLRRWYGQSEAKVSPNR